MTLHLQEFKAEFTVSNELKTKLNWTFSSWIDFQKCVGGGGGHALSGGVPFVNENATRYQGARIPNIQIHNTYKNRTFRFKDNCTFYQA